MNWHCWICAFKQVLVTLLIGGVIVFGFALCLRADPPDSPFLRKWNEHATEMNTLRDLLQKDIADRVQFGKAYKSFEKLHADPGWLK